MTHTEPRPSPILDPDNLLCPRCKSTVAKSAHACEHCGYARLRPKLRPEYFYWRPLSERIGRVAATILTGAVVIGMIAVMGYLVWAIPRFLEKMHAWLAS